ncbi:MAG: DUF1467 family protein [Alphaproteobacteria bacterium]
MQPVSAFVVFVIIWWLVIFCVLPIGLPTEHEEGDEGVRAGGAPKNLNIKKKLLLTTLISAGLWIIVFIVIQMGIFDLREFVLGK